MSLAIDPTVGGAAANSYNSEDEIDLFAQTMSPSDAAVWAAIDDTADDPATTKAAFAARAARLLDTIPFPGSLVTLEQALQWPRFGVEAPISYGEQAFLYGAFYLPTQIPPAVKKAHAQLTVYLAVQAVTNADPFGGSESGALSSLKVGPINLSFRESSSSDPAAGRDYLSREIYPLLLAGNCASSSRQIRLTR